VLAKIVLFGLQGVVELPCQIINYKTTLKWRNRFQYPRKFSPIIVLVDWITATFVALSTT